MPIKVGYLRRSMLVPGKALLYRAGQGENHIEARVTVSMLPGTTGVYVHLDEITFAGESVTGFHNGDVFIAGFDELYMGDEPQEYLRAHFLEHCRKARFTDEQIADELRCFPEDHPDKSFLIAQFVESLPDEDKGKYFPLQRA